MNATPQIVPIKLWHDHLMQRVGEFADMNEAMNARSLYLAGMTANAASKLLLAKRNEGLAN